jgi:hypothetical protein
MLRWPVIRMALITVGICAVIHQYVQPVFDIVVAVRAVPRIIFFVVLINVAAFTGLAARTFACIG